MRLGKVLAVVLLGLGCGVAAQAQLGVYGLFSATGFTGIHCYSTTGVNCSNGTANGGTGNVNPTGLSGGAYYDFKTLGPVRLGVDLRGGNNHANKSASSSAGGDGITGGSYFLGGVRGSIHTPISWLKPYAQISAGYAHSDVTEPIVAGTVAAPNPPRADDNFLQFEGFVGADIHVLPLLDLRAIELGIGNMNRIGSGTGTSSAGVRSIGVGVVLHLP
jgi:hypothetical protein